MANLRRSARLSRTATGQQPSTSSSPVKKAKLVSLVEREETSDITPGHADNVTATPSVSRETDDLLSRLNDLKTPQTEPKPDQDEMNPKTIHQSTTRAPDSGLRLGFADVNDIARVNSTPSKHSTSQSISSATKDFKFQFNSQPTLSVEAQKLMVSVKADAAAIKAQLLATKASGEDSDCNAGNGSVSPRKIATAKGKSSRYSDVHMEQFRKMDSIENHPSAFRARLGFVAPTSQSLKRKSSRADLDEPIRPRTAGKGTPRPQKSFTSIKAGANGSLNDFRGGADNSSVPNSAKRSRQHKDQDTSTNRTSPSKPTSHTLYSPTKASMARVGGSSTQPKILPRSSSMKFSKPNTSIRAIPRPSTSHAVASHGEIKTSPAKLPQSQSMHFKPLPDLPVEAKTGLAQSKSATSLKLPGKSSFASKFSSLTNLKSILRQGPKDRKVGLDKSSLKLPKVPSKIISPSKKVDFTPSVKSRYAVKLAAESPVPAKVRHDTPYKSVGALGVPYDASAYTVLNDSSESSEGEERDVVYPTLPNLTESAGPVVHTFSAKAKAHNRRESQEFRSIFTDLRPEKMAESSKLTAINTTINKTDPTAHASRIATLVASPSSRDHASTIRQVRNSDVSHLFQTVGHEANSSQDAVPGKKRGFDSISKDPRDTSAPQGIKNRKSSALPPVPGAWTDTILEDQENQDPVDNEGDARGAKRVRKLSTVVMEKPVVKKPNPAREAASKNAKERKGKGLMSLSRLNFLSRPKKKV